MNVCQISFTKDLMLCTIFLSPEDFFVDLWFVGKGERFEICDVDLSTRFLDFGFITCAILAKFCNFTTRNLAGSEAQRHAFECWWNYSIFDRDSGCPNASITRIDKFTSITGECRIC